MADMLVQGPSEGRRAVIRPFFAIFDLKIVFLGRFYPDEDILLSIGASASAKKNPVSM